jgi:hypothetical protein
MKTIVLAQSFPFPPMKVLKRYLDKKVYKSAFDDKVRIEDERGGTYRIGVRRGKILLYRKTQMIVHTLRYDGWGPATPDAVVVVLASQKGKRTNLRVSLIDLPDDAAEGAKADMKAVFAAVKNYKSDAGDAAGTAVATGPAGIPGESGSAAEIRRSEAPAPVPSAKE